MGKRTPTDVDAVLASWRAKGLDFADRGVRAGEPVASVITRSSPRERRKFGPDDIVVPSWELVAVLPIPTVSVANKREHWAAKARRVKSERTVTANYLAAMFGRPPTGHTDRLTIALTRLGGRRLDDDNLRSAMKAVRDGVSGDWLGWDDADPRLTWAYSQEPGGRVGVRISIEHKG